METTVTQRINKFRETEKISISALSKVLEIGQTTLNKQLREDGCGASISTVVLLLETYPDLSAEWLMRGEGSMYKEKEVGIYKSEELSHYKMLVKLLAMELARNGIDLDRDVQIYTETKKGKKETA